jgi:uncharacterized protein YbbK (DUF523 family)
MQNSNHNPPIYLVSACLMGLKTRYDGQVFTSRPCEIVIDEGIWLPVCPEQLGGLSTPRAAADLVGGDGADVLAGRASVVNRDGDDVTENFILGARQVLEIALRQKIKGIFLKSESPSCGLTPRLGVTAALLSQHKSFYIKEFE